MLFICACLFAFARSGDPTRFEHKRHAVKTEDHPRRDSHTYRPMYTVYSGGKCQTMSGGDPSHEFFENDGDCEDQCNHDSNCYGYSNSNEGHCLIWTQKDIMGGGEYWGGSDCHIKITYTTHSNGKCQTTSGGDPSHKFYENDGDCEDQCNHDSNCYGYSNSNEGHCLIWTQRDITGGGDQWGGADCHIKDASTFHMCHEHKSCEDCANDLMCLHNTMTSTCHFGESADWSRPGWIFDSASCSGSREQAVGMNNMERGNMMRDNMMRGNGNDKKKKDDKKKADDKKEDQDTKKKDDKKKKHDAKQDKKKKTDAKSDATKKKKAENAVGVEIEDLPYMGCFEERSEFVKAFLIDSNEDTYGSPVMCYFICKDRGSKYFGISSKSCKCSDDTAQVLDFDMGNDEVCTKYGQMDIGSYLHRTMAIYSMKENAEKAVGYKYIPEPHIPDGKGQWKWGEKHEGNAPVYCGADFCSTALNCDYARQFLKEDKDSGDLSGCPEGWKTKDAYGCGKKNFWSTYQYLRICEREPKKGCTSCSCNKYDPATKTFSECGDPKVSRQYGPEPEWTLGAITCYDIATTNWNYEFRAVENSGGCPNERAVGGLSISGPMDSINISPEEPADCSEPYVNCYNPNTQKRCFNTCAAERAESNGSSNSGLLDEINNFDKNTLNKVDYCVECTCNGYDHDSQMYYDCQRQSRDYCKKGFCVRCKQDGVTPMSGHYTRHNEECSAYSDNVKRGVESTGSSHRHDYCMECTCSRYDEKNKQYSGCSQQRREYCKAGYCVRCEQNGFTSMPGFYTKHDQKCHDYSQRMMNDGDDESAIAGMKSKMYGKATNMYGKANKMYGKVKKRFPNHGTSFECPQHKCRMHCQHGYVKDNRGCDTCECASDAMSFECPQKMCRMHCHHGYVKDNQGCDTCECASSTLVKPRMGICENNDDLAVSLFVGAADFNVNDCDSAFRFIDVNQLTCDNAIESLTLFGMINTEVETDGKTFADICCQSCTQIQCTLDVDSSQMASGECTDGQESFEFCGKTQCITNPDCKYADFGLDDANDNFLCPMESFDDHYQMRTSGKCQGETMIHEISTDNHSGLCKTAADMLGATYKDFGAKKPSDMKALAKAKFPLGCSYNPNKMIVYYNPMNAGTTKYNYDASENKRAICLKHHEENAVGILVTPQPWRPDGEGQWKWGDVHTGTGPVYCGAEFCSSTARSCREARQVLKVDKDSNDLSGCPRGWKTSSGYACRGKNMWGTSQYLRECSRDPAYEERSRQEEKKIWNGREALQQDSESAIAGLHHKKHKNLTNIGLAQSVSANSLNLSIGILATIGAFSIIYYGCKAINAHLLKSYEFTQIKDVEI